MSASTAFAHSAFKRVWIGATVCAVAFGATIASSAVSYASSFPTAASRAQLAATTGRDTGLSVLLGPVSSIDTIGGYTVYKVFVFLTTIGALWALLATTRLLRGEEDTGRWQLSMSGSTRPSRATVATLGALGAAVGVIFTGTTIFTLLVARKPDVAFGTGETLLFAASIVIPAAVFVGVGAVTSQLCPTRRGASSLGVVAFGVAFVLRMVADSGSATHWLLWATPFGWTERIRALAENNAWPLVPAAVTVVVLCGTAAALASARDVGAGVFGARDVARMRRFGLGSASGLTIRRELPVLAAWCAGAVATGLMLGVIAKVTASAAPSSLNDALANFGVHGTLASQYFGVAFLVVATVVALLPAGQVGAAGEEETSGRLVQIITRPTSRTTWFVGRLGLSAVAVLVAAFLAGVGMWVGARSQGIHVAFPTIVGAGLNVAPTAFVALAAGAVVLAIAPRFAGGSVYVVVGWSLVVDLSGSLVSGLGWLDHASLFHYMALAPSQRADSHTLVLTTVIALTLTAIATLLFRRRDFSSG